ncbi:MAG: dihydroorotase [Clostridia bacterium]
MLIKNVKLNGKTTDILIEKNRIAKIGKCENFKEFGAQSATENSVIDGKGLTILPAFVDMHVHLREPGFEYKEDIESGSKAAVAGGFGTVCCMPNTKPTVDNKYIVRYIIDRAKEVNLCKVLPIGAISVGLQGELMAEMGKMQEAGAIAMSDDGQPVKTTQLMRLALEYAKQFNILLISHCEDKDLANDGVVNEGFNATKIGLKGIPSAAEDVMIARDIILAEMLDTRVHIAHVSTKTGVQMIREAKARGVKVTCESCPHYIAGTDDLIVGYNTMAKVNPPLREEADRQAIIKGLQDGTIDVIVTDHAPHAKQDKDIEFEYAANGISGLETSFALCYTTLVDKGLLTLDELSNLMSARPAKILGVECGSLAVGGLADLAIVDLDEEYKIDSAKFYSKGKNTPFNGKAVKGKIKYTIVGGELKYSEEKGL